MATSSPSYRGFQANFDRLVNAVSPVIAVVARKAFQENLVSAQNLKDAQNLMLPEDNRSTTLLLHVLGKIEENPIHFDTFVTILHSVPVLRSSAQVLRDSISCDDSSRTKFNAETCPTGKAEYQEQTQLDQSSPLTEEHRELADSRDLERVAEALKNMPGPADDSNVAEHKFDTGFRSANLLPDKPEEEEYKFTTFAATYFQGQATPTYIRRQLSQPLLALKNQQDREAALEIWIMILRFMGDLPEPKLPEVPDQKVKSLGKRLRESIGKTSESQVAAATGAANENQKESLRKRMLDLSLKKLILDMVEQIQDSSGEASVAIQRPTTNLEKLYFIIGYSILRPELRDEIYCQICKQLSMSPSKSSHARGWVLLALCIGCFTPSSHLTKYLRCFISEGPPGYVPYCEERLRRTMLNGVRHQPPSWLELQATKSKKPLMLPITFMDGNTKTLLADSATTAKELCTQLDEKIGLKDSFGFSLYIALYDEVSSVGRGGDHVMDAITMCEQCVKAKGGEERTSPWRLFYRKEIFAPWHNPADDPVGTNLIFQQVVRGIKFGEYRFDKNEDLAAIAAQQYYVEMGNQLLQDRLARMLPTVIPDSCLAGSGMVEKWMQMVVASYKRAPYVRNRVDRSRVKEEIVKYAQLKWPLLFSRFYEAYRLSGPSLPKNEVNIAVNWNGVYIVDDEEHVLLECTFPEITCCTSSRTSCEQGQSFTLATVKGQEYTFTSVNGEDIRDLINYFLEGLRKRSKYVIALMDYQGPGEESAFLGFKKGDLIHMENAEGDDVIKSGHCYGECIRTRTKGDFPAECVYVLPTISRPTAEVLAIFTVKNLDAIYTERRAVTTQSEQSQEDPLPSSSTAKSHSNEQVYIDH